MSHRIVGHIIINVGQLTSNFMKWSYGYCSISVILKSLSFPVRQQIPPQKNLCDIKRSLIQFYIYFQQNWNPTVVQYLIKVSSRTLSLSILSLKRHYLNDSTLYNSFYNVLVRKKLYICQWVHTSTTVTNYIVYHNDAVFFTT